MGWDRWLLLSKPLKPLQLNELSQRRLVDVAKGSSVDNSAVFTNELAALRQTLSAYEQQVRQLSIPNEMHGGFGGLAIDG